MSSFSRLHDDDEPSYTYNITGVAISNQSILILSTVGFGLLGFAVYFLILRRVSGTDDRDDDENDGADVYGEMLDRSDVATLNRAQRRARAKFRMKKARRAVVPGQQQGEENDGDGVDVDANRGGNLEPLAETNLSRKERQRAAKAMEREERRKGTEQARIWRERKQSTMKSGGGSSSCDGNETTTQSMSPEEEKVELPLEQLFPRREKHDDPLSEFLFWESTLKRMKDSAVSYEEMLLSAERQMPQITICEFIQRLQKNGSVSIAALADELGGISIPEALVELENINKRHGIVGILD
eukprot:CAMPEP_0183722868 /NCGR_PEP_ID=MMETSP0737-20130205/14696_1 /TAXON_ID=385413 /ORGANISM="Thalassiosira miniscula, Strain CCMP1093" /LENGTH=297 /DNA_ID=CAMNT_0025953113 /DNA_START=15 /DNA_END=905 /DNA_ORIENTATION=+